MTLPAGVAGERGGLGKDGIAGARADAPTLVNGEGTEGTAAAAAAVRGDAELDHLDGGDRFAIGRVRKTGEWERVEAIEVGRGERAGGRGKDHGAPGDGLVSPGSAGMDLTLKGEREVHEFFGVGLDLLVRRKADGRRVQGRQSKKASLTLTLSRRERG